MVNISVDDKLIHAEEDANLLKTCLDNGIYIPNLCYLEGFEPAASCRLCFVEIEGEEAPVTACSVTVKPDLAIRTDTPAVRRLQKTALQLLLSVHHVDCKNCPANKKCALQDLARHLKVGLSQKRFDLSLKTPEIDGCHPCLNYYPNRCVLCGRCVRLCRTPNGLGDITFARRGFDTVIGFFGNPDTAAMSAADCQRCIDICPVGALVMKSA